MKRSPLELVVVSGSGCGVGVRMRVTRMCDIMGWWPEGADDHVSLLTSECIWAQSLKNEALLLWPGQWLEPQRRPCPTHSTLSPPGVKHSVWTSVFWSSSDTETELLFLFWGGIRLTYIWNLCVSTSSVHNRKLLFCPVGGSVVPVQHHSRQPAAGAGCHRRQARPDDHSPARQGAYPSVLTYRVKQIIYLWICRPLWTPILSSGWLRNSEGSSLGHQQPDNKWEKRSGTNLQTLCTLTRWFRNCSTTWNYWSPWSSLLHTGGTPDRTAGHPAILQPVDCEGRPSCAGCPRWARQYP